MMYDYSAWKNYKNVPRFIKEYARWKINSLVDNEYLDAETIDVTIRTIFDRISKLEYGYVSIDECIDIITRIAFNSDRR